MQTEARKSYLEDRFPRKKKLEVLKSRDEKTNLEILIPRVCFCRGRGILEISFSSSLTLDEKSRVLEANPRILTGIEDNDNVFERNMLLEK